MLLQMGLEEAICTRNTGPVSHIRNDYVTTSSSTASTMSINSGGGTTQCALRIRGLVQIENAAISLHRLLGQATP